MLQAHFQSLFEILETVISSMPHWKPKICTIGNQQIKKKLPIKNVFFLITMMWNQIGPSSISY